MIAASSASRVLHWCVTRYCPRRCIYCYAEPLLGGRAPDAVITREELSRIFEEAVTLGTEHLMVAGSEPFLRKDVPEVMGDALQHGITPFITTKHPVTNDLATRLARAGVAHCIRIKQVWNNSVSQIKERRLQRLWQFFIRMRPLRERGDILF